MKMFYVKKTSLPYWKDQNMIEKCDSPLCKSMVIVVISQNWVENWGESRETKSKAGILRPHIYLYSADNWIDYLLVSSMPFQFLFHLHTSSVL